jgi:hypothetical protein
MIDGLTSASSLSNLSCWLPNVSLKAQALKLENPVFRIHHSGPFMRIVRIKGVMDSEGKGKSGPVVAKVAPVSAVRWAGQAGWSSISEP